jgi:hypothetical protein
MIQHFTRDQEKKASFGDIIGKGIEGYSNYKKGESQRQAIEKAFPEAAAFPPEIQKLYIAEKLKHQSSMQDEKQKQDFLSKIFGGEQQNQTTGQQLAQGGEQKSENGLDPSLKQNGLNPSKITDKQIAQASAMDPNLGRILQQQKDVALRENREIQKQQLNRDKFKFEQEKQLPEHQRDVRVSQEQAKSDVKYNSELQNAEKQHKIKTESLNRLEKLNFKGVTGKPFEKLLEKAGLVNLTSEGRREFAADVKNLITDIRSILGGQFSQFEFQTILNAYPSADFSKEANTSIIKNLQSFQDIRNKEFEAARRIKKENGGKIPEDFQSIVNEEVNAYASSKLPEIKANTQKILAEEYGITPGNILMLDPSGEPLDISPQDVERYQQLGATLP